MITTAVRRIDKKGKTCLFFSWLGIGKIIKDSNEVGKNCVNIQDKKSNDDEYRKPFFRSLRANFS
jgi:hypothetical protein